MVEPFVGLAVVPRFFRVHLHAVRTGIDLGRAQLREVVQRPAEVERVDSFVHLFECAENAGTAL